MPIDFWGREIPTTIVEQAAKTKKLDWIDFLKPLSQSKQHLILEADDPQEVERAYNAFMINRSMSYHRDVIMFANEMNMHTDADARLQHDFYFHALQRKARFSKWFNKGKLDDLKLVKEYFNYGNSKAEQALKLLSPEDLQNIRDSVFEGGVGKKMK